MRFLLYPEDADKEYWDLFITLVLLLTCFITPYRIAYGSVYDEPWGWQFISYTIDFLFLVDIGVIFNSAFYNDEFLIVEDRKIIAKAYLHSWFVVDLCAIIPFNVIIQAGDDVSATKNSNYEDFLRLARFGRMYKLIKIIRLLRVLKIIK